MPQQSFVKSGIPWAAILAGAVLPLICLAAPAAAGPAAPTGVWRGTSTCTDRVAAPACHDEVVDGERQTMGEFSSPRSHTVWCLTVDGAHMAGTGRMLPGNQTIRKIDVRKD